MRSEFGWEISQTIVESWNFPLLDLESAEFAAGRTPRPDLETDIRMMWDLWSIVSPTLADWGRLRRRIVQ